MRRRWALAPVCATVTLLLAAAAAAFAPSDPLAAHPAYATLNLPAAWDITTGSPAVVIAVVDTGVDPAHPDLTGAVLQGHDFIDDDTDAVDPPGSGHGTAVAGAAAARAGNGIGGVGTCFRCSVLPIRVLGPGGVAAMSDVARAIDYAVDHDAAVVNVSLYGENASSDVRAAITRAEAAGVLVVAAAGNEATSVAEYPAAFPQAIAVGSATYDGRRASFSSYGPWVDVAAPECAPVPVLGGGTGVGCMTSTSSPLVAGIVALMRAYDPYASPEELRAALTTAARTRPVDGVNAGFVDAAAALRGLPRQPPRPTPTIFGEPVAGRRLEAFTGIWSGARLRVTFQWERCRGVDCSPIPGATRARYTPVARDGAARLRVVVHADDRGATSMQTRPVEVAPRPLRRPAILGRPSVETRLRVSLGKWEGTMLRFTVNWLRCRPACETVATGRSYPVRAADRGAQLVAEVAASNVVATATARSRPTNIVR